MNIYHNIQIPTQSTTWRRGIALKFNNTFYQFANTETFPPKANLIKYNEHRLNMDIIILKISNFSAAEIKFNYIINLIVTVNHKYEMLTILNV